MPTLKVPFSRARAAASTHAGLSTIRLVLVRMPWRCAWTMPRLIPLVMPKSSAVTMSHRIATSFIQRRTQRREIAVPVNELLRRPFGRIMLQRDGDEENAVGLASNLGGVQQQVQVVVGRKAPAGRLHGFAIALHDPRPLLAAGAIQERPEAVGERPRHNPIPVDELRAQPAAGAGNEHGLWP